MRFPIRENYLSGAKRDHVAGSRRSVHADLTGLLVVRGLPATIKRLEHISAGRARQ
jgi:hypothetical protein